jgi:hypothetical protein
MQIFQIEDGHPDIIDLALIADYLYAGGSLRGGGRPVPDSLKDVMSHVEECQLCRETVMDIHDTIVEVEQMSVKPWERKRKNLFIRIYEWFRAIGGTLKKLSGF